MKPYNLILLLALWLTSCNDFLEESSQDEVRPSTVEDLDEVLNGEAYCALWDYEAFDITQIFTDDIQCNGLSYPSHQDALESNRWKFSWDKEMFDANGAGIDVTYWYKPYQKIKGCNVILDYLDRVTGSQTQKEHLRGEAYTMRGYYYFLLVNFFGLPYNMGDPATNPGVPLKLSMSVTDELFERNTVAEVYKSIEHDLLEGNRLMEENEISSKSLYKASHLMAKALLSRMYLYMENWDKAIEYAGQVIDIQPTLLRLADFNNINDVEYGEGVLNIETPDEIIWATPEKIPSGYGEDKGPWGLSDELFGLFDQPDENGYMDLRLNVYLHKSLDWNLWEDWYPEVTKDLDYGNDGIRNAEMYLNRAEGYLHKFIATRNDDFRKKALNDLNYLREYRYNTKAGDYKKVDITDSDLLLQFYKDERRRELCGENNHRWFDIRRCGEEVRHVYFANPGEEIVYKLEKNDSRYALPIPENVRIQNPELEQNK